MKTASLILILALPIFASVTSRAEDSGTLENNMVTWRWRFADGKVTSTLAARGGMGAIELTSEIFQVVLEDGTRLKQTDFIQMAPSPMDALTDLAPEPGLPRLARHYAGKQLILRFANEAHHLETTWNASLREGASYLRLSVAFRAVGGAEVRIKEIILFDQKVPGAEEWGGVDGSPVFAGTFFCGCEHSMSQNTVTRDGLVQCLLGGNVVLKDREGITESLVAGLSQPGQMRRSFLTYIERERAHPYRPFLHYNSWFDIAWDKQKFNEAQSLNVIEQFGSQLVKERGVQMDSFLFDDGWDDDRTLWRFHSGFPNGFTGLKEAAARYHSGIGVWISPFGGYDEARRRRLDFGSKQGYETNSSGFSLAGPKYYALFRDICSEMIQKYGVNQFKFDGLAAGARTSQNGLSRDGDAMLQLVRDLRATDPDIYINQTTGTWPSPFWLLDVDSTWRGGADHDFQGKGSWCQRWMTYRDAQIYQNVVKVAPLYPLNSLMSHGIIYATNAAHLQTMTDEDFADQAREFFGSGTQLQEMYLTPGLLNHQNWDDLAEAANWSRRNADVLVDTHWVGGDPGLGRVYGWASWSPRAGIVTLRNPSDQPAAFATDLQTLFDLPPGSAAVFQVKSPWKQFAALPAIEISSRQSHIFNLRPFEVIMLEANPIIGGEHIGEKLSGPSTALKTSTLQ